MMLRSGDLSTNTLYQLAVQARHSGSLHQAILTYMQVVRLIDPADTLALSQVLWELGSACLDFHQPQPAISVLGNARKAAEAAHLPLREAECLTALGRAFRQTKQPQIALTCFQQALSIARTLGDQQLEVVVLQNLGDLCAADLGEVEQASNHLEAALTLLRSQKDPYTQKSAITTVRVLGMLCSAKIQRKETIGEVFPLLVEAENLVPLTHDPALVSHISYLMDTASTMHRKYTQQSQMTTMGSTVDDEFAWYEE
jgi:tetratricopeptide (TPR) repeat protein